MRRLVERILFLSQRLARMAGVSAVALLALALAIGAHGAVFGAVYTFPVAPFSTPCPNLEVGPEENAALAGAERDLPFDSGASTSSTRHSFGGKDLVRFLSHRPVIICAPGGSSFPPFW
jgi:hypothetical protein